MDKIKLKDKSSCKEDNIDETLMIIDGDETHVTEALLKKRRTVEEHFKKVKKSKIGSNN